MRNRARTHARTHAGARTGAHTGARAHTHTYMTWNLHIYPVKPPTIHMRIHIHKQKKLTHTHLYRTDTIYLHVYTDTYTRIHIHTHTYIHTNTHTYIHTHIHTYTVKPLTNTVLGQSFQNMPTCASTWRVPNTSLHSQDVAPYRGGRQNPNLGLTQRPYTPFTVKLGGKHSLTTKNHTSSA